MLRRAVAAAVVVLALLAGVGALEAAWSSVAGSSTVGATTGASSSVTPPAVRFHVARPGDTLWSIADEHRGAVDQVAYVDALVRINGGAGIVAGQSIRLP